MVVGVVVPTVEGRKEYLERCLTGYRERTEPGHELKFEVVHDQVSCGSAWQEGIDKLTDVDFLHLTADDIVPDYNWLEPMIEVVSRGHVPCGKVIVPIPETLDENSMPIPGAPIATEMVFESGMAPDGFITQAINESEYPSIPFCSWEQWQNIGPMIACQYGTDKWFGLRARQAGYANEVCLRAGFYHYAAHAGRIPKQLGWCHWDRLTFDFNIAYPAYKNGSLHPRQLHSEWNTREGRDMARAWYRAHLPPPYPWEDPNLGPEYA